MTSPVIILPTGRDELQLHNAAQRTGDGHEFLSDSQQWGYSVSFRVEFPPAPGPDLLPFITVEVHVLEGMIGVGVLDDQLRQFVSSEVDATAADGPSTIDLRVEHRTTAGYVMVRNTGPGGIPSRFRVLGATLQFKVRDDRLLVPRACSGIVEKIHANPSSSCSVDVLVSHSSRTWDAAQTDRRYLGDRYARPDRLNDLPPFDSLPRNAAPYHGRLSVFRLEMSPSGVTGQILHHYDSSEKVQHACLVGDEIVVCFDAGVAVFGRQMETAHVEMMPECMERIIDPWFGGLHTVVPAGDGGICLVSSSGADAILWLDVPARRVVRRWRLPASRYGSNYALDETTWLSEHYVPNDLQLGHLNCAVPDGSGGVFCSVLGQGDIGRVATDGRFDLLVSGYVGCHGVRYDKDADVLYFSDSCSGRVMRVDGPDRTSVLFDSGSLWLHDALHVGDGLFLLTLGDTNRLAVVDTREGRLLAEWDFAGVGGSVQFLSPASTHPETRA